VLTRKALLISATSGVGTMLTCWVVLVGGPPDGADEVGSESPPHPATASTTSSPTLAVAGISRAFRVSTGCTLGALVLDL
jgi:hypothetical protein